jgi:hypothetical protein
VWTDEKLPFRKILKILVVHVPGKCERVLKALSPNIYGETNIPEVEQALSSRILHGIDIRLGI